jgi:predicted transcriptional regulator of viral defense system
MQEDKKKRIQEVISPEVLAGRDTDKQLLEWFGQIQRVPGGGYLITPLERGQKKEDPIMVD